MSAALPVHVHVLHSPPLTGEASQAATLKLLQDYGLAKYLTPIQVHLAGIQDDKLKEIAALQGQAFEDRISEIRATASRKSQEGGGSMQVASVCVLSYAPVHLEKHLHWCLRGKCDVQLVSDN